VSARNRVDVSAELRRMGELQKAERGRQDLIREAERERRDAAEAAAEARRKMAHVIERLEGRLEANGSAVTDAVRKVDALRKTLEAAEQALDTLRRTRIDLEAELHQGRDAWQALQTPEDASAAVPEPELPPDPAEEMAAVRARIDAADRIREALEPWAEWEKARVGLETHRAKAERLTAALAGIDQEKRAATQGAELPFTAVSFDDAGEVLLLGLPLGAASGFELCRLALEVTVAADPELGVVLLSGAEIDPESLGELHEFAEARDIQVIMDMWYSPGLPGEVHMVEGVGYQGKAAQTSMPGV
jgi:hypothetical protein